MKIPKTIKLKGNTSTLWEKVSSFHYFILIQTNASHLCPHSLTALASHGSRAKPNTKGSLNNPGDAVLRFQGRRKWWPELSGWTVPTTLFSSGKGWNTLIQPVDVDPKSRSKIEFQAGWSLIFYLLPFSVGSGQVPSPLLFLIHLLKNWTDSGYLTVYLSGWVIFKYFTNKKERTINYRVIQM